VPEEKKKEEKEKKFKVPVKFQPRSNRIPNGKRAMNTQRKRKKETAQPISIDSRVVYLISQKTEELYEGGFWRSGGLGCASLHYPSLSSLSSRSFLAPSLGNTVRFR